jgi:hypothetical protein
MMWEAMVSKAYTFERIPPRLRSLPKKTRDDKHRCGDIELLEQRERLPIDIVVPIVEVTPIFLRVPWA